jgi:hypothetical protein
MKRSIISAAFFLVLLARAPFLNAQSSLPVLSSAVGWWAGDGDATDRLGNHNGTFVGPVKYAPGMVNEAFSFDGVSSYVSIPDAPDLNFSNQMTVEAWIYPYGHVGPYDPVVKKCDPSQQGGFSLEFQGDTILFWVDVNGWIPCYGPSIPNNQWSHVAGTYDGQYIRIYVNAQEVGSGTRVSGSINPVSSPVFIATDTALVSRHFYGLIDEATLYNTALSASHIQSIYLAGSSGKGSSFRFITPATIFAQTNAPLTNSLQAVGGTPPYQWSISEGRLPNGVTLSTSGSLQGTPTETGDFTFGISVVDAKNATASGYVTITVPIPLIPYPVPSDVVAWWPFDDPPDSTTVLDRIGDNTGAKVNGPLSIPGEVGQALLFNGQNQYLSFQNTSALQFSNTDFTIEMWARFDSPGGGSLGEPSHILIGSSDGPGAENKWIYCLGGGSLELILDNTAGSVNFIALNSFSPTVGQWYHLALVRQGNTLTSYINGLLAGTADNVPTIPNTTAPITIAQAEFIGFFTGAIDQPTIYHRALLPQEIQAIFNAGTAGKTASLTIQPSYGGVGDPVTVHLSGIGFEQGAAVQLVSAGQTTMLGSPVTVSTDGTAIDTTFDLVGTTNTMWDVQVINPDNTTITLPAGFTLQPSTGANVSVAVVGLNLIRPGRPQTFNVFVGNSGNVDAVCVPVWIAGIPTNATVTLGFPIAEPPNVSGESITNFSQVPIQFNTAQGIVIPLLIPRIPPGGSIPISFSVTIPTSESFQLTAWANPPYFGSPFHEDVLDCLTCAIGVAAGFVPGTACLQQVKQFMISQYTLIATASRGQNQKVIYSLSQLIWKTVSITAFCAAELSGSEVTIVIKIINAALQGFNAANCGIACGTAFGQIPPIPTPFPIQPISSFDPNNQVGPLGVGTLNYLAGTGPLGYTISFENDPTATAPAQDVYVTDVLDPYKVNINTIQLGNIQFGTNIISVPVGVTSFSTLVDLRTNQDLLVAIDCTFDPNANALNWHFSSLDPDTMQTPEDPTVGFLPPDVTPPDGEGSVSFSVLPRNSIATGTTITNCATITFDYNPPINTVVWTNTFDLSNPTIQVQPLSPVQISDDCELRWGSSDTGSGVSSVAIDVSTNGIDYTNYLQTTSFVSMVFTGQVASTYWFRATVYDLVGHSNQTYVATDGTSLITGISPLSSNYMAWAQQYFGSVADNLDSESTVWGLSANPNGLGSPNFFKWYYNQSPFLADNVTNLPRIQFQNGTLTFTMVSRISEPDVLFNAEWTPNLSQPWTVLAIPPSAIITPLDGTFQTVTWPTSLQSANQGFYRLQLSLSPF